MTPSLSSSEIVRGFNGKARTQSDSARSSTAWAGCDLARPGFADKLDELRRTLSYDARIPFADRLHIDKVGTDSKRASPSPDKVLSGLERNSAGRDHLDLRERAFKILDIACTADRSAG